MHWQKIPCDSRSLQLIGTLNGGQSFRWSFDVKTKEWTGIFGSTVWKIVQQKDLLLYKVLGSLQRCDSCHNSYNGVKQKSCFSSYQTNLKKEKESDKCVCNNYFQNELKNYFRLDFDLDKYYNNWSKNDSYFLEATKQFYGIRILAQEPVENLFSFICSQNNHISRISGMIEKLCQTFGEKICKVDGIPYFAFPAVESMMKPEVEKKLRELKFGYRAKFIQQSASKIMEMGGAKWFQELTEKPYLEAKAELIKLPGIGPKHLEAVPVDTHVYQIAAQNYLPHLRGKKNVTKSMYREIGDHFRKLYGPYAGWAHTVLFCADLKKFQKEKPDGQLTAKRRKCY